MYTPKIYYTDSSIELWHHALALRRLSRKSQPVADPAEVASGVGAACPVNGDDK